MKFYRIFIVLSVLLVMAALLKAQTNTQLRLAQALERGGNYEAALQIYQKLFESGDHSFGVQFGMRKTLTRLRRYPELIRFFKKMIQLQPGQYMNKVELGRAYALNQQKEKALREWHDLLKNQATNSGVYRAVGRVMTELRLLDEATEVYRSALKRFKGKSAFYMDLANIYRAQLNYEQASFYLIKYYRANKKQLGFVRSQLNSMAKTDEAARRILTVVRQASQKNSEDNGLRQILASMHMRLRQFEPAFRIYRSLKGNWYLQNFAKEAGLAGAYAYAVKAYRLDLQRERNPKKRNDLRFLLAQSCFQLARHQARSGKAADAREQAGCAKEELTALSVQKNDKRNRWRALVLLGDMQNQFYNSERQAIALYRTVQQEAPTGKIRARASLKIAAIELKQNRLNAAEKDFAAVRFSTERAFAVYEQANLEYYRGNFSPAIRRLQKLQTQLQPQDTLTNNVLERLTFIEMYRKDSLALARFARAELFERQSKWEAAAEAFGKLAQTDIALALPALERAARIYLKHKRTPEAFVLLNGFLQRHPQNPGNDRVLLLLGRTYEKMNQPEQALNTYLTLIRSYPDSFYLEEARQQARTLKQSTGQPFQGD